MKKVLLFSAACLLAMSSVAQIAQKSVQKISNPLPTRIGVQQKAHIQKGKSAAAPSRTAQTGLYYTRPDGTYFVTWGYDGYGWGKDLMVAPPFIEQKYTGSSADPDNTSWTIGDKDASSVVDENGDYHFAVSGAFWFGVPTIATTGRNPDNWSLTDNSLFYVYYSDSNYSTSATSYGLQMMAPVSDHYWTTYNGNIYNNTETWGIFGWMYGTGTLTDTDDDGTTYAYTSKTIEQPCGAPAAPLYIDTVFIDGYSYDKPISEGTELYCYVCRPKFTNRGYKVADLDNVIETLTCTSKDTIGFGDAKRFKNDGDASDYAKPGYLIFTKKAIGMFGEETVEPFLINEDFVLCFSGFDQRGIDFGANGLDIAPEDEEVAQPGIVFGTWNDGEEQYIQYSVPIAVKCGFRGMFVNFNTDIWVSTETGEPYQTTELRAPAEGGVVVDDATSEFDYIPIQTPIEWYDDDGYENFYIDLPEWLTLQDNTVQQIVDAEKEIEEADLMYAIILEADPLTADDQVIVSTGSADEVRNARYAVLYVEGFEAKSDPIIVVQGDLSIEEAKELAAVTGIENTPVVKVDGKGTGKIYNLNGQQVNGSYKGIVIQNGKKVIKK